MTLLTRISFLFAPLALLVLLATADSRHTLPVSAGDAGGTTQGDVNCSQTVDAVDSLQILRAIAGLPASADCLSEAGDVDCSGAADAIDALQILRFIAGLPPAQHPGCETIGQQLPSGAHGEARRIALEVFGAGSEEAVYEELLEVMALLQVGVYTSEGGIVQQGEERALGDFYLYDFELRMMAASILRRDTSWGVHQVADALDQVGYREDGQPFTGADLNEIIHEATVDSLAAPEEESSFVPMLVRQLGVRHEQPYDLAEQLDVTDANFDALQMTLILMGLTLPVISEEGPLDAPASALDANSNGILTAQPAGITDLCADLEFDGKGIWSAVKYGATAIKKIGSIAKKVAGFIDIIHGEQLALSVQVKALDSSVGPTHYDHGAGTPGQQLKFRIEVRMLDDLGEQLVKCGWLFQLQYPPKGPIPGVTVSFQTDIQAQLKRHGTLDCQGLFCSKTTGADGVATLTFDPKSEKQPYGQGILVEDTGVVSGIARYQSKFGNFLGGGIAQFLVPKYGSIRWFVQYHGCLEQGAGGSAITTVEAGGASESLPCRYKGHASATHYASENALIYNITASNLLFELIEDPQHPDGLTYQLVEGSVTVEVTGEVPGCTISGGYTIPEPLDGSVHVFGGFIALDPENHKYAASGGQVDLEEHVLWECPPSDPFTAPGGSHLWILTTNNIPPIPDRPFMIEDPLQGSFDNITGGWDSHYEWYFEPIICDSGPAPVCALPSASRPP